MFENLVVEMIYPLNWPGLSSITYIVIKKTISEFSRSVFSSYWILQNWQNCLAMLGLLLEIQNKWHKIMVCFPLKHILLIAYGSYILARQITQVPPLNKFSWVSGQTSFDLHICHNMVTEYRNSSHKSSTEHSLLMLRLFPERENYWVYLSTLS